jgi:hypothetical protein
MKVLSVDKQILIVLAILVFVQLACTLGSSGGIAATSTPAVSGGQAEETPTANPMQVTQPPPVATSERGTPDEAKAMLQKAVDHYNSVGRDQALADFNSKTAPFFDRDLYVVCIGPNKLEVANGGFPQYVGIAADNLKDANGNPLGDIILNKASDSAVNSVDYQWVNPVSGNTEPKTLFFQKVGTDVCGVGAYNP